MKESIWMYIFIGLGIFTIVIMMLIQDLTTTSEEDFYLSKEVMEAAMIDSVDLGVYRETGDIRIIESKFVENFTRRFAESVNNSKNYTLEFYEIYECPPKATVLIKTNSRTVRVSSDDVSYDIITLMSGILETKDKSYDRTVNLTLKVNGGSVNGNESSRNIKYGGSITYNIKPNSNYSTEGMTVTCNDGTTATIEDNYVSFINLTSSKTCTVNLVRMPYTVVLNIKNLTTSITKSAAATSGGSVTIDTGIDATDLKNATITCPSGYNASQNGSKLTVNNIKKSIVCEVNLRNNYTVKVNVVGGSASKNNVMVREGNSASINIYPNDGYMITDATVSGEGCSLVENNKTRGTLKVENVTKDVTCNVTLKEYSLVVKVLGNVGYGFKVNPQTINVKYGGNVTISGSRQSKYYAFSFYSWGNYGDVNFANGCKSSCSVTFKNITTDLYLVFISISTYNLDDLWDIADKNDYYSQAVEIYNNSGV